MPRPQWHDLLPQRPLPMFSWSMNLTLIGLIRHKPAPPTALALAKKADLLRRLDPRGHSYPWTLALMFAALKDKTRFTIADNIAKEVRAQNRQRPIADQHLFPSHLYTLDAQQLANQLEQHTFRDPEDFELSPDNDGDEKGD